jgi:hypothetical protein
MKPFIIVFMLLLSRASPGLIPLLFKVQIINWKEKSLNKGEKI